MMCPSSCCGTLKKSISGQSPLRFESEDGEKMIIDLEGQIMICSHCQKQYLEMKGLILPIRSIRIINR